ncbi:MAG: hypothetical protein IPJ85_14880 [Flavobacteriales bacterium]|nr:hypothetical protein [Flavobacteriales bacterium]
MSAESRGEGGDGLGRNNIILFIDEITLVSAGGGKSAMDSANILEARTRAAVAAQLGAHRSSQYQYFEKDKATDAASKRSMVDEPRSLDAHLHPARPEGEYEPPQGAARGRRDRRRCGTLKARIADRFLPDKAIDLVGGAASKLRMEIDSKPEELDENDRRIMRLEIERESIKRENDGAKLAELRRGARRVERSATASRPAGRVSAGWWSASAAPRTRSKGCVPGPAVRGARATSAK